MTGNSRDMKRSCVSEGQAEEMFDAAYKYDSGQTYPHLNVFLEVLMALDKAQISHVHPEIMEDPSNARRVSQEIAWIFGLERVN